MSVDPKFVELTADVLKMFFYIILQEVITTVKNASRLRQVSTAIKYLEVVNFHDFCLTSNLKNTLKNTRPGGAVRSGLATAITPASY